MFARLADNAHNPNAGKMCKLKILSSGTKFRRLTEVHILFKVFLVQQKRSQNFEFSFGRRQVVNFAGRVSFLCKKHTPRQGLCRKCCKLRACLLTNYG